MKCFSMVHSSSSLFLAICIDKILKLSLFIDRLGWFPSMSYQFLGSWGVACLEHLWLSGSFYLYCRWPMSLNEFKVWTGNPCEPSPQALDYSKHSVLHSFLHSWISMMSKAKDVYKMVVHQKKQDFIMSQRNPAHLETRSWNQQM